MEAQTIFLVRHGQTVWNREGRVQGHRDSALTARGIEQARRAGRTLAALILEAIGHLLAGQRVDERLMEVGWGRWEGLTRSEIAARQPAHWQAFEVDRWHVAPPGGESYAALTERACGWLESVRGEPRLIVVGHGAWCRALRGAYLGLPPTRTVALDDPQDAVFRLSAGTIAQIETGP